MTYNMLMLLFVYRLPLLVDVVLDPDELPEELTDEPEDDRPDEPDEPDEIEEPDEPEEDLPELIDPPDEPVDIEPDEDLPELIELPDPMLPLLIERPVDMEFETDEDEPLYLPLLTGTETLLLLLLPLLTGVLTLLCVEP
jgi:hypothetical protein